MGKSVHIVPHEDGWAVKREGADRASSVHPRKDQALEQGRDTAKRDRTELVIHGCPDKFPSKDTSELAFIADGNLRDSV